MRRAGPGEASGRLPGELQPPGGHGPRGRPPYNIRHHNTLRGPRRTPAAPGSSNPGPPARRPAAVRVAGRCRGGGRPGPAAMVGVARLPRPRLPLVDLFLTLSYLLYHFVSFYTLLHLVSFDILLHLVRPVYTFFIFLHRLFPSSIRLPSRFPWFLPVGGGSGRSQDVPGGGLAPPASGLCGWRVCSTLPLPRVMTRVPGGSMASLFLRWISRPPLTDTSQRWLAGLCWLPGLMPGMWYLSIYLQSAFERLWSRCISFCSSFFYVSEREVLHLSSHTRLI